MTVTAWARSQIALAAVVLAVVATACEPPPSSEEAVPDAGQGGAPVIDSRGPGGAPMGTGGKGGTAGSAGSSGTGGVTADAGVTRAAYTVIVLPDTQYYSAMYTDIFKAQTDWIVANKASLNIAFVLHEGDIVDSDAAGQWEVASAALHSLDGVVPYFITAGNHEYRDGCRDSMIDAYFPASDFMKWSWFGGTAEAGRIENNYGIVPAGGTSWLILALEFGPRDEILSWADQILAEHPDLPALIVTHSYLYNDSTRFDHPHRPDQFWSPYNYQLAGSVNDGEQMWQKLVSKHDNLKLVFSGHALPPDIAVDPDATGRLTSTRPSGSVCHQILANYQTCSGVPCGLTKGGNGYLRIVRFDPASPVISVKTYSPYVDQWKTDDANQFELPVP
jgi:Calcineurin-like phosphoesterase